MKQVLLRTIAVAAVPVWAAHAAPQGDSDIRANIYHVFRTEVVRIGRFDGEPITDVRSLDDCTTSFTTRKGRTTIDFGLVKPPFAARNEADDQVTILPDLSGSLHRFTTPKGARGRDLQSPMYFSYTQCKAARVHHG